MITDKDMEDAKEILCTLKSIQVKMSSLTQEEIDLVFIQRDIDRTDYLAGKIERIRAESAEQARKEERIITLEEVRSICLIETSITTDDIDRLIEQAKSKETKQ